MTDETNKKKLWDKLEIIHRRVEWMTKEEGRSALFNGIAAQGHFMDEKMRLLDEVERILDKLEAQGT